MNHRFFKFTALTLLPPDAATPDSTIQSPTPKEPLTLKISSAEYDVLHRERTNSSIPSDLTSPNPASSEETTPSSTLYKLFPPLEAEEKPSPTSQNNSEIIQEESHNNKWAQLENAENEVMFNRILEQLIEDHEGDIQNCICPNTNRTPLHLAARKNYINTLKKHITQTTEQDKFLAMKENTNQKNFLHELARHKDFANIINQLNLPYSIIVPMLDEPCILVYEDLEIQLTPTELNGYLCIENRIQNLNNKIMEARDKLIFTIDKKILPELANFTAEFLRVIALSFSSNTSQLTYPPVVLNGLSGLILCGSNIAMFFQEKEESRLTLGQNLLLGSPYIISGLGGFIQTVTQASIIFSSGCPFNQNPYGYNEFGLATISPLFFYSFGDFTGIALLLYFNSNKLQEKPIQEQLKTFFSNAENRRYPSELLRCIMYTLSGILSFRGLSDDKCKSLVTTNNALQILQPIPTELTLFLTLRLLSLAFYIDLFAKLENFLSKGMHPANIAERITIEKNTPKRRASIASAIEGKPRKSEIKNVQHIQKIGSSSLDIERIEL